MAVRGVYTEDEKKMLAEFELEVDKMFGWAKSLNRRVASEESIKNKAMAVDYWNPLWRDENYAAGTRWHGIIAPPFYEGDIGFSHVPLHTPPTMSFSAIYIGEDWKVFQPVHVNDSFQVWFRRPILEDITSSDGKGPRMFKVMAHDIDYINQRNEPVSSYKLYLQFTFFPEPTVPMSMSRPSFPEYSYTKEELEYIDHITDQEEIRGADIRYWEDVNVGDETRPVILGPTTIFDMVNFSSGSGVHIPVREGRRNEPWEYRTDPDTGVSYHSVEVHLSHRKGQTPIHFGNFARQLMARLVTNWMGDDGFIRKFGWRHMITTPVGDTVIGRGKVINKRVENGEHLVDLEVYLENIRGHITEAAVATVSLYSKEKEAPYVQ